MQIGTLRVVMSLQDSSTLSLSLPQAPVAAQGTTHTTTTHTAAASHPPSRLPFPPSPTHGAAASAAAHAQTSPAPPPTVPWQLAAPQQQQQQPVGAAGAWPGVVGVGVAGSWPGPGVASAALVPLEQTPEYAVAHELEVWKKGRGCGWA